MTDRGSVFIARAGPVGLSAAAALVRAGVPVTVSEGAPALSRESRASTFLYPRHARRPRAFRSRRASSTARASRVIAATGRMQHQERIKGRLKLRELHTLGAAVQAGSKQLTAPLNLASRRGDPSPAVRQFLKSAKRTAET
jgi:hypothetical protein